MSLWAHRRKWAYIIGLFIIYLGIMAVVYYGYIYQKPTCSDGVFNGDEQGVDCGGACVKLCPRQNLEPIVHWSQAFEASPGMYNLVAYVENPNLNANATIAPYQFSVLDTSGNVVYERKGITFIPTAKIFVVFDGPVSITKPIDKITFAFDRDHSSWFKADREDVFLKVNRIRLTRERPTPRIDATLENTSLAPVGRTEAVAIVYDDGGSPIAVSRTFADSVSAEGTQDIVFTWQKPFIEQFAACEVPADIILAIDRSGSMAKELVSVKKAATTFVDSLGKSSRVGVVSFASEATKDTSLSGDTAQAKNAVEKITIRTTSTQTNIMAALKTARGMFNTDTPADGRAHSIVLLTDGIPTEPKKTGDNSYPKTSALVIAKEAAQAGIGIYTIGLGKDIDQGFLSSLASNPGTTYIAPTASELESIYSRIASALCKKNPVIEVLPRIYPRSQ